MKDLLKVQTFNESDEARVHSFVASQTEEPFPLFVYGADQGRTVFLETEAQVIGVGSVAKDLFHPAFDRLSIFISDTDPQLAVAITQTLKNMWGGDRSLQISLEQPVVPHWQTFLDIYQFSLALECECLPIDVEQSLALLPHQKEARDFQVKPYCDLCPSEKKALREFRVGGYIRSHSWSPPVSAESPLWLRTDLSPSDEKICWAAFQGEEILLCSDAHHEGEGIWLGWSWQASHLDDPTLIEKAWATILQLQLSQCLHLGKRLWGEFDSVDVDSRRKKGLLSSLEGTVYAIFQQKRGQEHG